jgi:glutathione S-transferase
MAIKLHRCGNMWVKFNGHPCWKVQQALDEQGLHYETVTEPWPFNRAATEARTGQKKYPWIEFDDGSVYREESKDMAETIRAGRLESKRGAAATP